MFLLKFFILIHYLFCVHSCCSYHTIYLIIYAMVILLFMLRCSSLYLVMERECLGLDCKIKIVHIHTGKANWFNLLLFKKKMRKTEDSSPSQFFCSPTRIVSLQSTFSKTVLIYFNLL